MGIAPNAAQYPDSWYITCLHWTLDPHASLYQYIINHQLQAESFTNHLGTASAATASYEAQVATVHTFCQTLDHANHNASQEKHFHKGLQAESNKSGGGKDG